MISGERRPEHQRPARLEALLQQFQTLLGPLEEKELAGISLCDEPVLYIMGCARSGTTLTYQYLAQSGLFTYPTNFVSRFFYAPCLGARLQEMLIDADFRNEVFPDRLNEPFESRLGKTSGPVAPHEFWYFWRRFFHFGDTQVLDESHLKRSNPGGFIRSLRAYQSVVGRPLVLKGMILNWNVPLLASLYSRSHFLYVHRDTAANAASLLQTRREFFSTGEGWYSFKPPGYERVLGLDRAHQTAWQVLETNAAIEQGLSKVAPDRVFRVQYEEFCQSPRSLVTAICERWGRALPPRVGQLPAAFDVRGTAQSGLQHIDWSEVIRNVGKFAVQHRPANEISR